MNHGSTSDGAVFFLQMVFRKLYIVGKHKNGIQVQLLLHIVAFLGDGRGEGDVFILQETLIYIRRQVRS